MTFRYSSVDRFKMASWLDELKSPLLVQRRWRREYNLSFSQKPPDVKTIKNAFDLAYEVGLADRLIPGRPRTSRSDENSEEVVRYFSENPQKSTRRAGLELNLSHQAIIRILHERGFRPYRLRRRHAMNEADHEARVLFATDILEMLEEDPQMLHNIIFSDEAHFSLNGCTNTWNSRYWDLENPDFHTEVPLHSPRVSAWAAIWSQGIIGPFFFEDEHGATATVTSDRYVQMLETQFLPAIQDQQEFVAGDLWFMQDGAPPHIGRNVRTWMQQNFAEHEIGRYGNIHWPARSPDLTPMDFFVWGWVKEKVYQEPVSSLCELKARIVQKIQEMPLDFVESSLLSFKRRLQSCIDCGGHHIEY